MPLRPGFDPARVAEVLKSGGDLPLDELLHCRVRYFTDGLILGSQDYVDEMFLRFRSRFGEKRQTGVARRSVEHREPRRLAARPMRGGFAGLFTAKRLRLDVITVGLSLSGLMENKLSPLSPVGGPPRWAASAPAGWRAYETLGCGRQPAL